MISNYSKFRFYLSFKSRIPKEDLYKHSDLRYLIDNITFSLYCPFMEIVVLKQAEKELRDGPKELMEDIYSLFDDLSQGKSLGMPISSLCR